MHDVTCGTHFGETKLVVSMTGSPDRDNWFTSSILTSVGINSYNHIIQSMNVSHHYYYRPPTKQRGILCRVCPSVFMKFIFAHPVYLERIQVKVGCLVQWWNVGISPANFPRPTFDLQLTGYHLCKPSAAGQPTRPI